MMQTVLMFLAPAQSLLPPRLPLAGPVSGRVMATRPSSGLSGAWRPLLGFALSVAGNALGLILFLAGLGLVLRLAEILLS